MLDDVINLLQRRKYKDARQVFHSLLYEGRLAKDMLPAISKQAGADATLQLAADMIQISY